MPKPKTVTAKMVMRLVEEQGYRCALSGRELTPQAVSLDHIVPLSRGGAHDIANLWALDQHVNTAKGTLLLDEFITLCRDVAKHHAIVENPAV
jgi:5-methylcytosine-specific restriction endonuclease McrA